MGQPDIGITQNMPGATLCANNNNVSVRMFIRK